MPESAKEGDSVLPEGSDIGLGARCREFESPSRYYMDTLNKGVFFAYTGKIP